MWAKEQGTDAVEPQSRLSAGWQDVHTFLASSRGRSLKATILSRKLITLSVLGIMGCVRTPDTALEAVRKVEQQTQISVDKLYTYCLIQSLSYMKKMHDRTLY